jgi:hypothetical protein
MLTDGRRTKSDDNSSHGLKARWAKKGNTSKMGNGIYFKIAGCVCKHVHHVKIYLPSNSEVNLIAHLGVIALFHHFLKILILILFVLYFKNYNPLFSIFSLVDILVGSRDHRTQFGRGPSKDHSTKVWLQLAQWFLRRRLKCEMLTDGRRTKSDDNSSHGLKARLISPNVHKSVVLWKQY